MRISRVTARLVYGRASLSLRTPEITTALLLLSATSEYGKHRYLPSVWKRIVVVNCFLWARSWSPVIHRGLGEISWSHRSRDAELFVLLLSLCSWRGSGVQAASVAFWSWITCAANGPVFRAVTCAWWAHYCIRF